MTKTCNRARPAYVFGVDIGKTVFHLVGLDRDGAVIQSIEGDVTLYGFDPSRCNVEGVSGSVIYKTGAP